MNRSDIMTELANSGFVEAYLRKECFEKNEERIRDFAQEVYVIMVSDPNIEAMHQQGGIGRVKNYAAGIIKRQLTLSNSVFNTKYRRHDRAMNETLDAASGMRCSRCPTLEEFEDMCCECLNDWERYALSTYRECGYDPKATAEVCGVSKQLVVLAINAIVNKIKKNLQK